MEENKNCSGDCSNCQEECNEKHECSGDCSSCGSSCSGSCHHSKEDFLKPQNKDSNIKNVIAITSGKGGVGKSMTTAMLAVELSNKGYKVGILDADITGPSIPKLFGIKGMLQATESSIIPAISHNGIKIVSSNLLLENETDPIIWRGPVIAGLVEQFWTDVAWGDIDYLLVDMPPGTGDVPLTIFQSLPVNGTIIVTTPQDLVSMIVEKAINMALRMEIKVYGIVENMSYFICPSCDDKHYLFGKSNIESIAVNHNIDIVCEVPINPILPSLSDEGLFDSYNEEYLSKLVNKIIN